MKRLVSLMAVGFIFLTLAAPALASSLGVSPSHIELEVPADGNATAAFQIYYFSGDVKVEMVDIPLRVEPQILHVDALDVPEDVQLTIFGDESLGSRVYNGFIKFIGMSGEMIAIAVQVRAKITNIVAGEEPVPVTSGMQTAAVPDITVPPTGQVAEVTTPGSVNTPLPQNTESSTDIFAGLSLNTVIIIAAGVVFLGLVILAISLARRRY
jgi:hypothetical protein